MGTVVEIGQQKRLRQLRELDDAADDVLANPVDDAQTETLVANDLEDDRLQLCPALAAAKTCNSISG